MELKEQISREVENAKYANQHFIDTAERILRLFSVSGQLPLETDNGTKSVLGAVYTEEEVERLLITQRGNCYVAILSATKDQTLAELASKAPEPWSWRK